MSATQEKIAVVVFVTVTGARDHRDAVNVAEQTLGRVIGDAPHTAAHPAPHPVTVELADLREVNGAMRNGDLRITPHSLR